MSILPFPHGDTAGTIGENVNINSKPVTGTTKGMLVDEGGNATSAKVNRGLYALSTNIDHIMTQIQDEKARLSSQSFTSSGDASRQLTGSVFVGTTSFTTNPYTPFHVCAVLDAEGNELVVSDEKVVVIDIQNPGSLYPISAGSEFSTDPTVVFGKDSDKSALSIPSGVGYTIVFGLEDTVDELDKEAVLEIPLQRVHEMGHAVIRELDRSTENAIIGDAPTLTWGSDGADQNYVSYTTFWCVVRGRIMSIAAGDTKSSYVNDNSGATLYVDQWGTVGIASTGGTTPPGRNVEEELVLGRGATGSAAWTAGTTANIARGITAKPAYVTVGSTDYGMCNFNDLENAIAFLNYLWGLTDETVLSGESPMEYPRILICNSITFSPSAAITLAGPLWIEGATSHFSAVDAYRYPRIEFDVTNTLIDCDDNHLTIKNLDFLYTGSSNRAQNTFLFANIGHDSTIERMTIQAPGAYYMSGILEVQGRRVVIRDCYFDKVSETNNTPGISAVDAGGGADGDGLIIENTTVRSRNNSANEVLVSVDDCDRVVIRDCLFENSQGTTLSLSQTSSGCGTVTCERTTFSTTGTAIDGDSQAMLLFLNDCSVTGDISIGTSTPPDGVTVRGTVFADSVAIYADYVVIEDRCDFSDSVLLELTAEDGSVRVEDSVFAWSSGTYGLKVHLNPGVAVYGEKILIRGNRFTVTGSLTSFDPINVNQATGSGGLRILRIDDNTMVADTSAASPSGFNGIVVDDALATHLNSISGNRIEIDAANTYAAAASRAISVETTSTGAANGTEIHIRRNSINMQGTSNGSTVSWANIGSDVALVYFEATSSSQYRVWLVGNNFVGAHSELYTAAYLEGCYSAFIQNNEVRSCHRGLIALPGALYGVAKFIGNHVDFGHDGAADDGTNWYDSAVGLCTRVNGSNKFKTNEFFGNTVVCNGVGDSGDDRHCIHGEVTASTGRIAFYGNHVFDDDTYEGSGAVAYAWYFDYTNVDTDDELFVPNDGGTPEDATSAQHNTYPSAFSIQPNS